MASLVPGIGLEDPGRFALGLAALGVQPPVSDEGIPLEAYLASRRGSCAMVLGRSEELGPLLFQELRVSCVVVPRKERDEEVPEWASSFLRSQGRQLWVLPEALRGMPRLLKEEAWQGFDEILLGPEPWPPLPELYETWGVTHWVGHRWSDETLLRRWIRRGGHAMDCPGYGLGVHAL